MFEEKTGDLLQYYVAYFTCYHDSGQTITFLKDELSKLLYFCTNKQPTLFI